jgi:hypothetical protein
MHRSRSSTVAVLLITFMVSVFAAKEHQTQPPPWQAKHAQLQLLRDSIFSQLEEIQSALVLLVGEEDSALLTRLSLEPAKPRAGGYGLLPEIRENPPLAAVSPKQTLYSLKWLERRLFEELENTESLSEDLSQSQVLEALVNRFENLLKSLRHLENHLSYQQQWQESVVEYPEYFQKNNRLIEKYREIDALTEDESSETPITELSEQLIRDGVSFRSTPGLALLEGGGGEKVLPVVICTDIEDEGFLQDFEQGVDESFNQSAAATEHRISVELNWRVIAAKTMYPDGAPRQGDTIDMASHFSMFTDCPLVLTTGASSSHAMTGKRVVLGTDAVSRRTLAHEFGHLLGFEDAYIRGYDGDPGDPYGVVLVEWSGLTDDLMGNPDGGQVSNEMITTLISAYGEPAEE